MSYQYAREKEEFEQAGFTDFDAKLRAWQISHEPGTRFPLYFNLAVPVCTAYWNTQSWLRHVDWTIPANAMALAHAFADLANNEADNELRTIRDGHNEVTE